MYKYLFIILLIIAGCRETEVIPQHEILADEIIEPYAIGSHGPVSPDSLSFNPDNSLSGNTYLLLDTIHFDAFIKILSKRVIGNYEGVCYIEDSDFFQGMLLFEYDTVNNSHLAIKELYKSDDGVRITVEGDCLSHTQFYVSRVNFKQDSIKDTFIMGPHRWDISIYYNEGFVKTKRRTNDIGAPSYTKVDGYFYKK